MTLTKVSRKAQLNASADQPRIWTLIEFETTAKAARLANALAALLDDKPSVWYSDFNDGDEKFVVFPKRVFRYRRGDALARRKAQSYAQSLGVPQLDWME